jgi:hypothetical protein
MLFEQSRLFLSRFSKVFLSTKQIIYSEYGDSNKVVNFFFNILKNNSDHLGFAIGEQRHWRREGTRWPPSSGLMAGISNKSRGHQPNTRRLDLIENIIIIIYYDITVYPVKPPLPAIGGNEGFAVVIQVFLYVQPTNYYTYFHITLHRLERRWLILKLMILSSHPKLD